MQAKPAFRQDPSATASFERIRDAEPVVSSADPPKAVVIGGGTGAPVSIQTLLSLGVETSAVVAMADDGGSTGALRDQANVTPPGDVRKCIAAFAANPQDPLTQAFKYRFTFANNHTLGNLMLSALENATGSFPEAVRICERLLNVRGHVYPSTLDNIHLCGLANDGAVIQGQANISHANTALAKVWLEEGTAATPYPEAIKAVCEADLIVLGPGSLFTSVIPNLLVPGMVEAIESSKGKTLFVCGIADMQGETRGLSAEDHVQALMSHGMNGMLDYVLVHAHPLWEQAGEHSPIPVSQLRQDDSGINGRHVIRSVSIDAESARRIEQMGPKLLAWDLADKDHPTWHDPEALRNVFTRVLQECLSQQR